MEKKDQEVAEEYLSSLADLNLNSKPLINMLTILAEENIEFAPVIVKAVEQHIAKVNHDVKLPVLYLIDSIVKNVGREYIQLFSHSIVNIFCGVFEKVNEKVREKMYTLRQTWNDVFTPQKLYTLDVKVNCMDPNWPITAKVVPKSPAIHVNPNFLKNKGEPLNEMEAKLRDKQRQLLELQKRKLELELAATKQRLEEQEKQLQSTIQGDNLRTSPPATVQPTAPAQSNPAAPNKPNSMPANKPAVPKIGAPTATAPLNFPAPSVPNGPKIRVAPVNSALVNSIRQRDPRLARKQQQQEQAALAAAAAANLAASTPNATPDVLPAQTPAISSSEAALPGKKDNNTTERNALKMPHKAMYGSSNREKSKSQYNDGSSSGMYNPMSKRAMMQKINAEKSVLDGKKSPTLSGQQHPSIANSRSSSKSHSNSSSSRSTGSSRSSARESSKSSRHREKDTGSSSSYDRERKRKIDSSPNKTSERGSTQSKYVEKSPKRHADNSTKSAKTSAVSGDNDTDLVGSPIKFRDIGKHTIKLRNYMRRNREKTPSPPVPNPPPPPSASSPSKQDADFRDTILSTSVPQEKRLKTASNSELTQNESNSSVKSSNTVSAITSTISTTVISAPTVPIDELSGGKIKVPSPKHSPSVTNTVGKPDQLEKNVDFGAAKSAKDIDLRHIPSKPVAAIVPVTLAPSTVINSNSDVSTVASPATVEATEESEPKKRPSEVSEEAEEPAPKKPKSDNMVDSLFGTEDVDLRTLSAPVSHLGMPAVMPATPPPPPIISNESENWAKVKGTKSNSKPSSKSRFEDVRAKLAKAAKGEKFDKELKSFRKASRFSEVQEDSQDGTDSNIRTIISQAQEMLQSENMDVDQYNTLMKTVIQINEASKLREAQRRESLLVKKDGQHDLTPISDEEVEFSSDEESGTRASKSKIMAKRIPKKGKRDENSPIDSKFEQNSVLRRSPSPSKDGSHSYSDSNRNQSGATNASGQGTGKFDKRGGRQKDQKWSPWETNAKPQQMSNKPKWIMGNSNFRPNFPPPKLPNMMNTPNIMTRGPPPPCPWQNPPQMIFAAPPTQTQLLPPPPPIPPPIINPILPQDLATATPGPPMPPPILLPQLSNSVDNPNSDVVRTINIDGVPKEIRFYDEIAIAFMDWDQPKEIGFQSGQRRIMVDDHDVLTLSFNDAYKPVMIDKKPHKMRFGCPTRELYIDGNWFECYFGDPPIQIFLDGRLRVFKIEGPAPQVRIGNIRQDLVVGKINLIIDAIIIVPVFLDAKVQTFKLNESVHTLQFADCLKTVLIDSIPFDVEYGGLPKSIYLAGVKRFVRFGTLPNGIVPGKINILNMIRTDRFASTELPLVPSEAQAGVTASTALPTQLPADAVNPGLTSMQTDVIAPISIASSNGDMKDGVESKTAVAVPPMAPGVGNFSIDELFQKLLSSGILNQNQNVAKADEKKDKLKDSPITPIDLSRPDTIKSRQSGLIQRLFTGMQCSSCGVRFPPEQTMKYSQHLDWHFRQNRKERDNSRRAHSRKWYYDVSDWIQYEEIEDLDDREKNWFEAQQNEAENIDENSNQRTNSPPPSCPAGPDDVDKCCDMCHDKFEQFYNEESEEWHLRDAIRVDEKIYHPICYEDYKASLIADESIQTNPDVDDNAVDTPMVKTEKDGEPEEEVKIAEISDDDDDEDDVIVLPAEEPSIQEIPDDDEDVIIESSLDNEILVPDSEASIIVEKSDNEKDVSEAMETDDVEIQEPHIPFTDLDTYVEKPQESISTVDDSSQSSQFNIVKIKEEPKDDGYNEDDAFEEVGTIVCDDEISVQNVESLSPRAVSPIVPAPTKPVASSNNSNILVLHDPTASIDGNVEVQETPAQTSGINKIKINISKGSRSAESNTTAQSTIASRTELTEENSTAIENLDNGAKSTEEDDFYNSIQYTVKPTLQNAVLKKVPRTISGVDTSGLCSIM